jgi:tRNA(Ile)-lysidine synthase
MEPDPRDAPPFSPVLERFEAALCRGGLLDGVRRLLVGCSGGPDSTALALLFAERARSLPMRAALQGRGDRGERAASAPEILIGHVHHGIRGAEADADADFVRELARALGFPFVLERVRPRRAQGRASEGEARALRHAVFRGWAGAHALDAVALAHQREDQQETVLLRLARGTGIGGLPGMRPSAPLLGCGREVRIIRPLLGWSRREVLDYLAARGQCFRRDSMNEDPRVPRNAVRREVLPLLEERVHPGVRRALERLAEQAASLEADLEALGARAYAESVVEVGDDEIRFALDVLCAWPPSVRRQVLLLAERELGGGPPSHLRERTFAAVDALVVSPAREGARVDAGGGLVVEVRRGLLWVRLEGGGVHRAGGAVARPQEVVLEIDGAPSRWGIWTIQASRAPCSGPSADPLVEWIDEEALSGALALSVRGRRAGDRFWPLGAGGHKKLNEFLRERRVEPRKRDEVALVIVRQGAATATGAGAGERYGEDREEIVWVVGERIGHPFRVREGTRRTVRLVARGVTDRSSAPASQAQRPPPA